MEWLVGNTEVRESSRTEIDELMLDDFIKLMTDTEIYVDGIATMQIKNMNDWLDAVRLQITEESRCQ